MVIFLITSNILYILAIRIIYIDREYCSGVYLYGNSCVVQTLHLNSQLHLIKVIVVKTGHY